MGEVIISNEVTITDPSRELRKWVKDNLCFTNPDFLKKERMGYYTGNTPSHIYLYKIDGDSVIIPCGCLRGIKHLLGGYTVKTDLADNGKIQVNAEKIQLYDYQEEAVAQMLKAGNGILQSPCGSGKTQMGIAMAQLIGRKTLWVTHTQDLLNQSYERALQYIPAEYLGKITSGKVQIGSFMTFATVQTLSKVDLQALKYEWDVLMVDECHRAAGTPTQITMFNKVISNLACRNKYGLSATVHRSDGLVRCTFALLGNIRHVVPDEAVASKTMTVKVMKVNTGEKVHMEACDTDGTIVYNKLIDSLTGKQKRNSLIVSNLIECRDHSNLILSSRTEHLQSLIDLLPEAIREDACYIDGKMTSKKAKQARIDAIADMRSGKKRFLFATYNLAKEGLDIPCLDRLHMVTPQKDYAVVVQSIGRVGRVAEGKADSIAYDYVDDVGYCENAWKARRRHYKKAGCIILE